MSTGAKQAKSCPIPTRVLTLKDWSQLPDCYSQTPGGTLFSTTPGGTRIIYDRKFLLECRNSPLARTPPCCLPQIPGVTIPATHSVGKLQDLKEEEEKDVAGNFVLKTICRFTSTSLIPLQSLILNGYAQKCFDLWGKTSSIP